jgi:hypothetical protein
MRLISILIVLLLVVVVGCSKDTDKAGHRQRAVQNKSNVLECYYEVATSDYTRVSVTYEKKGSTQQQDIYCGDVEDRFESAVDRWQSEKFTVARGDFVYISAQRSWEGSGSVTVSIYLNGVQAKSATSSGEYVIASTSGRI